MLINVVAQFSFSDEQIRTLYFLVDHCLLKAYDSDSDFQITAEQFVLLGLIKKDIEKSFLFGGT